MSELAAARLSDPIQHSSAMSGLVSGLLVGVAVGIGAVLIAGTGGLAAVAIVGGMAAMGAGIGEVVGSMSFAMVPTGMISTGSGDVIVNYLPAARAHVDVVICSQHPSPPPVIAQGSGTVFIDFQPAARIGDLIACSASIAAGSPNVFIGGPVVTTDPISPEVPDWVHWTLLGVGLASAIVLMGPIAGLLTMAGSIGGGYLGSLVGGKVFGEGSDKQKWAMLVGSLLGGMLGAKGGMAVAGRIAPNPTFPARTANSDLAALTAAKNLNEAGIGVNRARAVTAITHEDGSLSIGTSGSSRDASYVREQMNGTLPENTVFGQDMLNPDSLQPANYPNGQSIASKTCAETRAWQAAQQNPSPVTGQTTVWRGDPAKNPYPALDNPVIMEPCPSCSKNAGVIQFNQ